jgi:hypothetical protein
MAPLVASGDLAFCTANASSACQLYNDPANRTLTTLQALAGEMAALFADERVFNIGADETSKKGQCSDVGATFALERHVADHVHGALGRDVQGWEELLFAASGAGGALPDATIIASWSRHRAKDVVAKGYRAIESHNSFFYLNKWGPNHFPLGQAWQDIADGVPAASKHLLLGGETSMWTDNYCYVSQCGAGGGAGRPVGAALFGPGRDAEFSRSVTAMVFPGAAVGAGAFWNFNTSAGPPLLPNSSAFAELVDAHTARLIARGIGACPKGCKCDELSQCGTPYLKPGPPAAGDHVLFSSCEPGGSAQQRWALGSDGKAVLQASANASTGTSTGSATPLCAAPAPGCSGSACYPLTLQECSAATTTSWAHRATGELVVTGGDVPGGVTGTTMCMDADTAKGLVGIWACSGGGAQVNQHWSVDAVTGTITGMSGAGAASRYAPAYGMCLTVVPGGGVAAAEL